MFVRVHRLLYSARRKKSLYRCFAAQTHPDIELIVVDTGAVPSPFFTKSTLSTRDKIAWRCECSRLKCDLSKVGSDGSVSMSRMRCDLAPQPTSIGGGTTKDPRHRLDTRKGLEVLL